MSTAATVTASPVTAARIAALAQKALEWRASDPLCAGADLGDLFAGEWDASRPLEVRVGGLVRAVYPVLHRGASPGLRREAAMLLVELADELAGLAASWDTLPSMAAEWVPWTSRRLALRVHEPPLTWYRTAAPPMWLVDASGVDIRAMLAAALAPVLSALRADLPSSENQPL